MVKLRRPRPYVGRTIQLPRLIQATTARSGTLAITLSWATLATEPGSDRSKYPSARDAKIPKPVFRNADSLSDGKEHRSRPQGNPGRLGVGFEFSRGVLIGYFIQSLPHHGVSGEQRRPSLLTRWSVSRFGVAPVVQP